MDKNIIRSYKTKGTKELEAFIHPGTAHYKLQWSGGGELPQELSGMYTSLNLVDTAVLSYLGNLKEAKIEQTAKEKYYAKQEKKSQEI
jgi:hypothetical protein|tara:strand:- start:129 stop:392 length:264 start_codon:yes stop_codon:yes gene_type:complete